MHCDRVISNVFSLFCLCVDKKSWSYLFYHNSIGREGLVDNVGEGFGHLDSIFSFARGDEMLSMSDIGRGKL